MPTKKTKKTFDAVKMMRDIRDKVSSETQGMSFDELKKYIESRVQKGELHHSSGK
jgi:hypothetical protein